MVTGHNLSIVIGEIRKNHFALYKCVTNILFQQNQFVKFSSNYKAAADIHVLKH